MKTLYELMSNGLETIEHDAKYKWLEVFINDDEKSQDFINSLN